MKSYRTPLAQARGLGATGSGTGIWFTQRVTWLATIVLSFLVLALLVIQVGKSYDEIRTCLAGFWPTLLLIVFLAIVLFHYTLELQEVIEDYIHNKVLNIFLLLLIRFGFAIVGIAAILMVLRNFFGV